MKQLITILSSVLVAFILLACDDAESKINYPTCDTITSSTTLFEKAAYYDEIAVSQHLPDGLLRASYLKEDLSGVEYYELADNAGFWTSIYVVSQVFRYKETGSSEALENVRTTVRGLYDLTKVTGKPGLWARNYTTPGLLHNDALDEERWEYGEGEYEGWRWKNDVSQDEYSGNMFALAVVYEYIDDEEILSMAGEIAEEVGDHLIDNMLNIVDVDGEPTTFGKMYALSLNDFPGFLAILTLSWIKQAYAMSGEQRFQDYYLNCLLKRGSQENCRTGEDIYLNYLTDAFLSLYFSSCIENYNNIHMTFLGMRDLIALEEDEEILSTYKNFFENSMWQSNMHFRDVKDQQNPYFTFLFAGVIPYNEVTDKEEYMEAIDEGICTLKLFPDSKVRRDVAAGDQEVACYNRFDEPTAEDIIPVNERSLASDCVWKDDPYDIPQEQAGDPRMYYSPGDFLAAYWMGRFYGFIPDDL